jgi:peroxiredoxin
MAPTFTLPNEHGDSIKLSEFIGKIVLLDFWASWCRPCRIENPKLVSLHDKYSTKGFEIISISLDGTSRQKNPKKDWIEAIQKDKLDWVHLSELNGWQTFVRELYNFNSIPYTVLIDEDGRIIGKNLKEDLESSIKKALNDE